MFAGLFGGTALTLSTLVTLLSMAYLSPCCRWPICHLAVDGLSTIPSICGLAPGTLIPNRPDDIRRSTLLLLLPLRLLPQLLIPLLLLLLLSSAVVCPLCFYYYPCFSCCCCCGCCGCYCCWNVDCFVHARHVICGRTSEIDDSLKRTWALYWAATRPECETYCPHDEVRSSSCSRK